MKPKKFKFRFLATNLGWLMDKFKENPTDLANALSLTLPKPISDKTIYNYCEGTRTPKPEILTALADHYRILPETLCNKDLTKTPPLFPKGSDNFFSALFPLITANKLLEKNEPFNVALNFYQETFEGESVVLTENEIFTYLNRSIELFENASRITGIIEGYINAISLMLMFWAARLDSILKQVNIQIQDISDIFDKCILNTFHDEDASCRIEEARKKYWETYGEKLIAYLLKVKKSGEYYDLAYYYLAILFTYNLFPETELTDIEASTSGNFMLGALAFLDNHYAIEYFKTIYD